MNLISPSSPPPKKKTLRNLCFSFLLGITSVPREIEKNAYAKFGGGGRGGANKVHYGRCASAVWPIFSLSPVTVPEAFAKVNSTQFPRGGVCNLNS